MFCTQKRFCSALLLLFLSLLSAHASEWTRSSGGLSPNSVPLPETLTSKHALSPTVAFWEGSLYLAWTEPDNHGIQQIAIKRLRGEGGWEPFGRSHNRDTSFPAATPYLAARGNSLYLAWTEKNSENISQLYVKEWTGSEWTFLGGSLNRSADREAKSPIVAFLNDVPYLAWNEAGEKEWSKLFVKHWDGKSWVSDGPGFGLEPQHVTQGPCLLFEGDTGHMVWSEADETRIFQIRYARIQDGKWTVPQAGINLNPNMQALNPTLSIFKNSLYLLFQEKRTEGNFGIQLRRLSPHGWTRQNESLFSQSAGSFNPVMTSDRNNLFIAWEEWSKSGIPGIVVKRVTDQGEQLDLAPPESGSGQFKLNPLLASDSQSTYLAWKETNDTDLYRFQVWKYSP